MGKQEKTYIVYISISIYTYCVYTNTVYYKQMNKSIPGECPYIDNDNEHHEYILRQLFKQNML